MIARAYASSYVTNLPDWVHPTKALPTAAEQSACELVREAFLSNNEKMPFMVDVIRAMRLLQGLRRYVEVGTWDKGCLAYASTVLANDALLIDVDVEPRPIATEKLHKFLRPTQKLVTVLGDSTQAEVLAQVREALGGPNADAILIDANHLASYAWADYANFFELLAPGGVMLFHDVYWRGTAEDDGVSQAMEWVDRAHPVHVVFADHPVHRFFPMFDRTVPVWGGVGLIRR